jgi:hypothetical protein
MIRVMTDRGHAHVNPLHVSLMIWEQPAGATVATLVLVLDNGWQVRVPDVYGKGRKAEAEIAAVLQGFMPADSSPVEATDA